MDGIGANNSESMPQWMPDVCQIFINSKNFKECYDEAIQMEPDPGSEPDLKLEFHCKVLCAKSTSGQTLDVTNESNTDENAKQNLYEDISTEGSNPGQKEGCLEDELDDQEARETFEQYDYRIVLNRIYRIDNNPNLTLIAKEREKYNLIKRFREAHPNSAYQFPEIESDNYDSRESDTSSIQMDEEQLPVNEGDRDVNTSQTYPKTSWNSPEDSFEREQLGPGGSRETSETSNVIRDRIEHVEKLLQGCQEREGYDQEDFGTLEKYDYRVVLNYINHIENDPNLTFIDKQREKCDIIKGFRKAYPNSAYQFPEISSDIEFDSSPILVEDDDKDKDGNNEFLDSLEECEHDSIEADSFNKSASSFPRDSLEISVGKVSIRINSSRQIKPLVISSTTTSQAARDSLESLPQQSEVRVQPIVQRESQPQRDALRRIVRGLMIQRIVQNAEMEAELANPQPWFNYSEREPGEDTILEIELDQTGRADVPSLFSTPVRTRTDIILEVQTSPISPRRRMRSFVEGGTRVFNDSDSFGSYEDSSITRWRERRFPSTTGGHTINQKDL